MSNKQVNQILRAVRQMRQQAKTICKSVDNMNDILTGLINHGYEMRKNINTLTKPL